MADDSDDDDEDVYRPGATIKMGDIAANPDQTSFGLMFPISFRSIALGSVGAIVLWLSTSV